MPSTTIALLALAAGIAIGTLISGRDLPLLHAAASWIEPIGDIWLNALQMIVVPLVITQLLVVVSTKARSVGALGAWSVIIFIALLIVGALFTLAVASPVISMVPVDPERIAALEVEIPELAREAADGARSMGFGEWLIGLVPTNFFDSLANGEFLQIILVTLLFGFAATRVAPGRRERLTELFEALAEATMVIVRWLLWVTPAAVFALALKFSRPMGADAVWILAAFAAITSALLVVFTLVLYPIATIGGGVPLRGFARAVYPAQVVAAGTRSSLATLPALIDGAERHLTLPKEVVGFALPFSASTFKVNRTVSSTIKLLFLAHLFDVPLSAATIVTFIATVIVLSFTSVGIPRGGTAFKTLPAYLAAGVPIEGVVLLEVVEDIPDIFKTIINTTGYMTVAALLSRIVGSPTVEGDPINTNAPVADAVSTKVSAADSAATSASDSGHAATAASTTGSAAVPGAATLEAET